MQVPKTIKVKGPKKEFKVQNPIEAAHLISAKRPKKKNFKARKSLKAPELISAKEHKKKEFKAAKSYEAKTIKVEEKHHWSDDERDDNRAHSNDSESDSEPSRPKRKQKQKDRRSDDEAEDEEKVYYSQVYNSSDKSSESESESESDPESETEQTDSEQQTKVSENDLRRLLIQYAAGESGPSDQYDIPSTKGDSNLSDQVNTFDPHEALSVRKTDTTEYIDVIRKKLLTELHPDKLSGKASEKEVSRAQKWTREINRAWEILGNASKRKVYDKYGITEESDFIGRMAVMNLRGRQKISADYR